MPRPLLLLPVVLLAALALANPPPLSAYPSQGLLAQAPVLEAESEVPGPAVEHTPAGAGASHGGLPQSAEEVPRSPNKRLLPATKEAGLWAADGAPATKRPPLILDVLMPTALESTDERGLRLAQQCAAKVEAMLRHDPHFDPAALHLPFDERKCLAARLYVICAERGVHIREEHAAEQRPVLLEQLQDFRALAATAVATRTRWCAGITMSPVAKDVEEQAALYFSRGEETTP